MPVLPNDTVIAGYRIDGPLGEGGMGTVYRATQLSLERKVALKLLTADLSGDPSFRERFRREGLLQAALDHPHIVTVYEAGQTEYGLFLAMRVVEGPTLKNLIQSGQLGDRRTMRLLAQVADALDAAHEKGLIHRDVKPQNVLVGAGDHAYLADFGLTRGAGDEAMTETGHFVGTIDYISPEQARGELATPQSDVYALTAVMYECLTGQVPYVRATEERVLLAHLAEEPPKPSEVRPDLPPAIDDVIQRGMAKNPTDRQASCSELVLEARRAMGAPAAAPRADPDDATRIGALALDDEEQQRSGATRLASIATVPAPAPVARGSTTAPRGAAAAAAAAAADSVTAPRGAEPAAGHRDAWLLGAVVVGAVLALVIGLLAGKQSSPAAAPAFTNTASAADIELSFPPTWRRLPDVLTIPGLTLTQPLSLASIPAGSQPVQMLLAGQSGADGPSLLPQAFVAKVKGKLPTPHAVSLGGLQAYRYDGVNVAGVSEPLTVYAIPTTGGVATIVCMGEPAQTGSVATCSQIAATVHLNGANAYPLAPTAQYAGSLTTTLAQLNSQAQAGLRTLRSATTGAAQAAAAARIAAAYRTAANAVSLLSVSPAAGAANAAVAASLTRLASSYGALGRAARSGDRSGYVAASAAATGDRASLKDALARLRSAGYDVSA